MIRLVFRVLARLTLGALLIVLLAPVPAAGSSAPMRRPIEWARPVPGRVTRAFSYERRFGPGHRGIDLTASAGAPVYAPCTGRVLWAGRTPAHGRGVTVRCGPLRATVVELARVHLRRGVGVLRGAAIGSAGAAGHIHLSARERGYIDPAQLLARPHPPAGPPGLPPPRARAPRVPSPPSPHIPRVAPHAGTLAAAATPANTSTPLAPWPAWLGLTLLLVGTVPAVRVRTARRRRRPSREVAHANY